MIFAPKKEKINYDYIEIYKDKIHTIRRLVSDDWRVKVKGTMYIKKRDLEYQYPLVIE